MANQQTVTFNINVPYKDQCGLEQVRTCVLTLTLSVGDLVASCLEQEGGGPGQITINGAVLPVDDVKGGGAPATAPDSDQDDFAERRAA
jgi:hypothetical protein